MSNLYLIRHGQAGTRDSYDSLSELGRRQAALLGQYLNSQSINFTAAFSGEMSRQHLTAEAVAAAYGQHFPQLVSDPGWNEFDLDRIYREIAPQLCAASPEFRREYEAMRQQVHASAGLDNATVHRRWLPCDSTLVSAWIAGAHQFEGETWDQFRQRIASCRAVVDNGQSGGNIAVFTSAVPIAIWTSLALNVPETRIMQLAAVLQNTSVTQLQLRNGELRLFSFNATPHLQSADLRTFR